MEIKSVPVSELNKYQESLLKKRKRDDFDQKRRNDARAKQKLDQGRQAKEKEKDNAGGNILMPEVFVSNHMKQQRNYVHYKRNKSNIELCSKAAQKFNAKDNGYASSVDPKMRVKEDVLLLVIRIKGRNSTTTP